MLVRDSFYKLFIHQAYWSCLSRKTSETVNLRKLIKTYKGRYKDKDISMGYWSKKYIYFTRVEVEQVSNYQVRGRAVSCAVVTKLGDNRAQLSMSVCDQADGLKYSE